MASPRFYKPGGYGSSPEEEEEPGLLSRGLHRLGSIAGTAGRGIDTLVNVGRGLYEEGDPLSRFKLTPEGQQRGLAGDIGGAFGVLDPSVEQETVGQQVGEAAFGRPSKDDTYGRAIGRQVTEFGADLARDPLTFVAGLGLGSKVAGGQKASRLLSEVPDLAPELAQALSGAARTGRRAELAEKAASGAFQGLMAGGAYEGGKQAYGTFQREGFTPRAAAEATGAVLSAGALVLPHLRHRDAGMQPDELSRLTQILPNVTADELGRRQQFYKNRGMSEAERAVQDELTRRNQILPKNSDGTLSGDAQIPAEASLQLEEQPFVPQESPVMDTWIGEAPEGFGEPQTPVQPFLDRLERGEMAAPVGAPRLAGEPAVRYSPEADLARRAESALPRGLEETLAAATSPELQRGPRLAPARQAHADLMSRLDSMVSPDEVMTLVDEPASAALEAARRAGIPVAEEANAPAVRPTTPSPLRSPSPVESLAPPFAGGDPRTMGTPEAPVVETAGISTPPPAAGNRAPEFIRLPGERLLWEQAVEAGVSPEQASKSIASATGRSLLRDAVRGKGFPPVLPPGEKKVPAWEGALFDPTNAPTPRPELIEQQAQAFAANPEAAQVFGDAARVVEQADAARMERQAAYRADKARRREASRAEAERVLAVNEPSRLPLIPEQGEVKYSVAAAPREDVPRANKLKQPIKGPTGAEIVGYEWRSKIGEVESAREGGLISKRMSDWDKSGTSTGTGRDIVHVFHVRRPDGTVTMEGIGSANKILGIQEARLRTIAKNEAVAQRVRGKQEAELLSQLEARAKDSGPETTREFVLRNRSPLREHADPLANTVLMSKDGRFIRATNLQGDVLAEHGWVPAGARPEQGEVKYSTGRKREYKPAAKVVSGLRVREGPISNTDSIGATLTDYETLPGIREVPLSDLQAAAKDNFYSPADFRRVSELAARIKESGEIEPLIVAVDAEGPYIIEGAHRMSALHELGVKSFPALVVRDTSSGPKYSAQPSPMGFYSQLQRVAEKIPQAMKGADLYKYLTDSKRGVKAEELKSLGTGLLEAEANGRSGDSVLLSNLLQSPAFQTKGLSGLSVPARRLVVERMLAAGENGEVRDSIVKLLPVDVVNDLRRQKLTPEMLFHDESVLSRALTVNDKNPVSLVVDVARSVRDGIAGMRAEVPSVPLEEGPNTRSNGGLASETAQKSLSHDHINTPSVGPESITPEMRQSITGEAQEGAPSGGKPLRELVAERYKKHAKGIETLEDGSLRVKFKDGLGDYIIREGVVEYDPASFARGRGREMFASEQIVGSAQRLGNDMLIKLKEGVGPETLGHEELHGLLALGRLKPYEIDALFKEHGFDPRKFKSTEDAQAAFRQAEEKVADQVGELIRQRLEAEKAGQSVPQPQWFDRMWFYLKRLWSSLSQRTTAEAVGERIASGEVYQPAGLVERGVGRIGQAFRGPETGLSEQGPAYSARPVTPEAPAPQTPAPGTPTPPEPTLGQKVVEGYKAGLVSGPGTQVANVIGNVGEQGVRSGETLASAIVDSLLPGERQRYTGEVKAELSGLFSKVPTAMGQLGKDIRDTFTLAPETPDPTAPIERRTGAIGGKTGRAVRVPFRLLGAFDNFFGTIGKEAELQKLAYRQAKGELKGADEAQVKARAQEIARNPSEAMMKSVESAKASRLFKGDPDNPDEMIQALINLRRKNKALEVVLPFIETPANIAKLTIQRSPLGFAQAAKAYRVYKAAQLKGADAPTVQRLRGEAVDAIARPLLGSVLLGTFYGLAKGGSMTGSGPTDQREKSLLRQTGWQPYSFVLGEGQNKTYVPFNRFEPLSSFLGFAADAAESKDSKTTEEFVNKAMGSVVSNLTSKTYLQGVADAAEFINDPARFASSYLSSVSSAAVPNIVAKVAQAVDPTVRDVTPESSGIAGLPERIGNTLLARIPGASQSLPARRSATGDPIQREGNAVSRFLSPVQASQRRPEMRLEELMVEAGEVPGQPSRTFTVPGTGGKKIRLTDSEYAVLQEANEKASTNLRSRLGALERMDPEARAKVIKSAFEREREYARTRLMRNSGFRSRARKEAA